MPTWRSATVPQAFAHLCNITRRLKCKLEWDPAKERFPHDSEADLAVHRVRRKAYELPKHA